MHKLNRSIKSLANKIYDCKVMHEIAKVDLFLQYEIRKEPKGHWTWAVGS